MGREDQNDLIDIESLAHAQIKQILLISAVTGNTAVNQFVVGSVHAAICKQFVLARAESPDIGIAQHENSLPRRCPLQLDVVRSAQSPLILMQQKLVLFVGLPDALERRPTQLLIKTTENSSLAERFRSEERRVGK